MTRAEHKIIQRVRERHPGKGRPCGPPLTREGLDRRGALERSHPSDDPAVEAVVLSRSSRKSPLHAKGLARIMSAPTSISGSAPTPFRIISSRSCVPPRSWREWPHQERFLLNSPSSAGKRGTTRFGTESLSTLCWRGESRANSSRKSSSQSQVFAMPTGKWTPFPRRSVYLSNWYYAYFLNARLATAVHFPVYQRERRLD